LPMLRLFTGTDEGTEGDHILDEPGKTRHTWLKSM
jgi:hypothetical protein